MRRGVAYDFATAVSSVEMSALMFSSLFNRAVRSAMIFLSSFCSLLKFKLAHLGETTKRHIEDICGLLVIKFEILDQ